MEFGYKTNCTEVELNEYEMQAIHFLVESKTKCRINFIGYGYNQLWNDTEERAQYRVRLSTPRGKMTYLFWDSFFNTRGLRNTEGLISPKIEYQPSAYDVLACLEMYDPRNYTNFTEEFGMEDNEITRCTYRLCKKQYKDLERIFTPEQMDLLREIR